MAQGRLGEKFCEAAAAELSELILLAAPTGSSNLAVIERQERLWTSLGWRARRYPLEGDGPFRVNLVLTRDDTPSMLFCCHVDTILVSEPRFWTYSNGRPKTPIAWNGKIFGLGASDTLASAAVLNTMAIRGMLPEGVAVAFTAEEESGAIGAQQLVSAKGVPDSVRLVIVCEPTDNMVVRGTKGYVPFDIVLRDAITEVPGSIRNADVRVLAVVGQEAHSAWPNRGKNALLEAAKLDDLDELSNDVVLGLECRGIRSKVPGFVGFYWVPKRCLRPGGVHSEVRLLQLLEFLRRFETIAEETASFSDPHFNPPEVTMNVGAVSIEGCDMVLECDLRPVPGFSPQAVCDRLLGEAIELFPGASLRFPFEALPAVWTKLTPDLERRLAQRLDRHGRSAFNEAAVFSAHGLAVLIAGPGNQMGHCSNEYVELAALGRGAKLYACLARLSTAWPCHRATAEV